MDNLLPYDPFGEDESLEKVWLLVRVMIEIEMDIDTVFAFESFSLGFWHETWLSLFLGPF